MYEFIQGKLVEKHPTKLVVECNGIGYELSVSVNTSSKLEEENCKLFTHLVVREDDLSLFGFLTRDEREMFRNLIDVSGIGPNTAIVVLSGMSAPEVREAVLSGNVDAFKGVKGVGPKTAQRAIVDLKDKLEKTEGEQIESGQGDNSSRKEALSALTALGFDREKARKALEKSEKNSEGALSVEAMVKEALRHL